MAIKDVRTRTLAPRLRFPEFNDQWQPATIGDLFTSEDDREKATTFENDKILTVKLHANGVVRNERTSTLTGGASYFKRRAGQFIFSKIDLLNGAFGVVPDELDGFYSSSDVPAFSFGDEHSPAFFINWLTANYRRLAIERTGTSATLKRVSPDKFRAVSILLPDPAEQRKIAACLTSLDELLAAERRKLEALRAHKSGLMQQLFPRKGESHPRLRFPEFRNVGEWKDKTLDDLARRGTGHTPNKAVAGHYNGGIRWISLADSSRLDKGLISETAVEISEQGIENSSAVLHSAGTVVLSRDAGVGKSGIMGLPMAVSQHFITWTCRDQRLSNWFLYYILQRLKPELERVATGSTIKTIGMPFFAALRVTVPEFAEQQRIASCLFSLDDLIAAQSRKLDVLRTHKKGLMQQIFPWPEGM